MKEKSKTSNILTFFIIVSITLSIPSSYATINDEEIIIKNRDSIFLNYENEKTEIQYILKLKESISVSQDKKNHDKPISLPEKIGIIKLSENISVTSIDYDYPTIINVKHQSDKQTTKERIFNLDKIKSNSKSIYFLDNLIANQNPNTDISTNLIEIFSLLILTQLNTLLILNIKFYQSLNLLKQLNKHKS